MSRFSLFAFENFSGIIATNLGKTATITEVAGRERRVHHSKSLPLLLTGERFFFAPFPCARSAARNENIPKNGMVKPIFSVLPPAGRGRRTVTTTALNRCRQGQAAIDWKGSTTND
jgi:hypothetical protein